MAVGNSRKVKVARSEILMRPFDQSASQPASGIRWIREFDLLDIAASCTAGTETARVTCAKRIRIMWTLESSRKG